MLWISSDKTQDHLQNGSTCNGTQPTVGGDEVPTELAVKPPKAAGNHLQNFYTFEIQFNHPCGSMLF